MSESRNSSTSSTSSSSRSSRGSSSTDMGHVSYSISYSRQPAEVCNVVDAGAGTVTNCIDFETGEKGSAVECLRVRLTATGSC